MVLPTSAGKTFWPDTGLSQESPFFSPQKKNELFSHPTIQIIQLRLHTILPRQLLHVSWRCKARIPPAEEENSSANGVKRRSQKRVTHPAPGWVSPRPKPWWPSGVRLYEAQGILVCYKKTEIKNPSGFELNTNWSPGGEESRTHGSSHRIIFWNVPSTYGHHQINMPKKVLVGGWTNPFEKICDNQNGFIFPNVRGERFKNIWVATTLISKMRIIIIIYPLFTHHSFCWEIFLASPLLPQRKEMSSNEHMLHHLSTPQSGGGRRWYDCCIPFLPTYPST